MEATRGTDPTAAPDPKNPEGAAPSPAATPLQSVLARARAGDSTVLPQLKAILDAEPSIWQRAYQLVAMAEQTLLDSIAGRNLLLSQSIRRQVEQLKSDLGGEAPTPLEKLLVDRIASAWLAVQHAQIAEAASDPGAGPATQMLLKRLDAAHRRFLAATKALAVVRRLSGGLKVEISHRQSPGQSAATEAEASLVSGVRADAPASTSMAGSDDGVIAGRLREAIGQQTRAERELISH